MKNGLSDFHSTSSLVVLEDDAQMRKYCCHCKSLLVRTDLGTCVICGYEQDPDHIEYVKKAQAEHDLACIAHGIQNWPATAEYYRVRRRIK